MRQILSLASLIASAVLLLSAGAALAKVPPVGAGGWATVELDPGVPKPTAGGPVTIGFTLLQRGTAPISQGEVIVEATGPDGKLLSFPARAQGTAGHWVVELTLPKAGRWSWAVTMPDQLPVTTPVQPLQVAAVAPVPTSGGSALPILVLAFAALLLAAFGIALRGSLRTAASRALGRS